MDQAHYKRQTMKAYDQQAGTDVGGFDHYFDTYVRAEAQAFLALLTPDSIILDLGCGAGVASTYFQQQGYFAISADLSAVMLQECCKRGLKKLVRMDLETFPFLRFSFDAIWAHTSLLHIPKAHLRDALHKIGIALKPQGVFFIALKEGKREGYIGSSGTEKWLSHFQGSEFKTHLPSEFEIMRTYVTNTTHRTFLYYWLRKIT
jgi:SAM-dependent methyltransferase